jgi:hypothetical protein
MKESFGAASNFLPAFQARGFFFLDDLVLYSIDQIEDKNELSEHRQKVVESLAQRMADDEPSSVVALMCAIEPMVADAMREAGLRGEYCKRIHVRTPFQGSRQLGGKTSPVKCGR